ncbi:hypothetical protein EMIHUDRAFT_204876 [Emiliania huxleyi CCMP1516]|uniref:Carbohydrate kinase PfkB domain-containing protein n=2 Tax=Emiliania huxleyi TaxID=2903 RepID=A0A0D3JWI0_EMIH1|nr:hypothetical protein EMIHUDRAFT_204876 [Emiliania huxleyi CCMP1516]EOD27865.1 hypothetical protein EMIHUDRAFT_204876 [Emiliania huxleyi CCMP1516]|eukprot:XP_005780294.1 hypothetical protein EMIHUDRAFT_204876 [Emiliania huxleyi CCMP1516]
MATRRAALIGDAFVDVQVGGVGALPCWGTDVACSSVRLLPGGACGNTARQLGALGGCELEAFFYSCVGDDEPGRHYLRTLEAEGSLTSPSRTLRLLPGVPQSCCVILSGSEDRAMCSCYETVHRVTTGLFSAELLAESWALVHLGGYFNCVGLHDDALLDLLRALKARWSEHGMAAPHPHDCSGKWSGEGGHLRRLPPLDGGMGNKNVTSQTVRAGEAEREVLHSGLLPLLDVFLPNEAEACGIASVGEPTAVATAEEAIDQLTARHPSTLVVVKAGGRGILAGRGGERWEVPAAPVEAFVDATGAGDVCEAGRGAGDACSAGFLAQYLRDPADVPTALRWGAAVGALCVSRAGACETPLAAEEVRAVLECGAVRRSADCGNGAPALRVAQSTNFPIKYG